jgi:hypothetical protein
MNRNSESPSELARDVNRGASDSTPFVALGGVIVVVSLAVIAVIAIVVAAVFLAG